jgi:hypothetical protein
VVLTLFVDCNVLEETCLSNDGFRYDHDICLEMPVPNQGHYGFHSFPVVD